MEKKMIRKKPPPSDRKQIGATLDAALYRQMRAQAMLEDRTVAELLDDAMTMYLDSKKMRRRT